MTVSRWKLQVIPETQIEFRYWSENHLSIFCDRVQAASSLHRFLGFACNAHPILIVLALLHNIGGRYLRTKLKFPSNVSNALFLSLLGPQYYLSIKTAMADTWDFGENGDTAMLAGDEQPQPIQEKKINKKRLGE